MSPIATPHTLHQAADYLASADPILAPIIASAGLPTITPHKNYYQELVESIISQQLSVKAAATILRRFVELFPSGGFPPPDEILAKDIEVLRGVGLSRQKASYIQDLARRVIDNSVRFNHLDTLTNDEVVDELTQIKGVGVWTVHMFLLFCMGRLDVLPTGDLGIRNGIQKLYDLTDKPSPDVIEALAKSRGWHPYESVASWYIWHSLDNKPTIS